MEETKENKLVFENDFIADFIIKQDQKSDLYKCVKYQIFNENQIILQTSIQDEMSKFNIAQLRPISINNTNDTKNYQYSFIAEDLQYPLSQYNKNNINWKFIKNFTAQVLETLIHLQRKNAFLPEITPDKIWIRSGNVNENFLLCDFILMEFSHQQFKIQSKVKFQLITLIDHLCYKKYYSLQQANMLENHLSFPEMYKANLYNLAIVILELGVKENELTQALQEKELQVNFIRSMNKIIDKFENKFGQQCPKIQHFGNCLKKMLGLQSSQNYFASDILKELVQNKIIDIPQSLQIEEDLSIFERLVSQMKNEFEENLIANNINEKNKNKFTLQIQENSNILFTLQISLLKNNIFFAVSKKDKQIVQNTGNIQQIQQYYQNNFFEIFQAKQSYDQIFKAYQDFQFETPEEVFEIFQCKMEDEQYILQNKQNQPNIFNFVGKNQEQKISFQFNETQPEILQLQIIFRLFVPPSGIKEQDINLAFQLKKINVFSLSEQLIIDEEKGKELIKSGEDLYKLRGESDKKINQIEMNKKYFEQIKAKNKQNFECQEQTLKDLQKQLEDLQNEKNQLSQNQ